MEDNTAMKMNKLESHISMWMTDIMLSKKKKRQVSGE